jgi:hypothetical protein
MQERDERHISPHRAWNSIKVDGEFTQEEHDHILRCLQCLRLFIICLEADTFGAVLKDSEDLAA